jgi:penicillin-insensitive murein endopeptidase
MLKSNYALGFIGFIFLGCSSFMVREASPEFAKWAGLKTPTQGPAKIYGSYQMGCIAGAKELPLEGPGYFVVHRNRARYYGHPVIINYITELGQKIHRNKYPMMIVEDISYPRGGPFLHGHNSHQIGLDVDISLKSVRTPPTVEESENWVSPSYVEDRKILLPNWGPEQIQLTVLAAEAPEVNRIFIAPAIKKYFCEKYANADWQYKLRSWWGHDDHLHIRLNCPADSPDCKPQAALDPKNNGCGVELDWWYSAEADADWKKMISARGSIKEFPKLPMECEAVKTAN